MSWVSIGKQISSSFNQKTDAPQASSQALDSIALSQQTIGNLATLRLRSSFLQNESASEANSPDPQTTSASVEAIIQALNKIDPIAGVSDFQAAIDILAPLSLAELTPVVAQLARRAISA